MSGTAENITDPVVQFQSAMQAAGIVPPDNIDPGRFYRFPGTGKKNGNTAGWCLLFDDMQGGVFGDWSQGINEIWQAKREEHITNKERIAFKQQIAEAKQKAESERIHAQKEAAAKALEIWNNAKPTTDHAYLVKKGVQPHGTRIYDGGLLIPVRNGGELQSLQFISPEGEKRFLSGGRIKGGYYAIGKPEKTLCVAEGFATGASIHEATGDAVAVAFDAGNLLDVAKSLRVRYPNISIIVCGDNDESGTGQEKAREAAKAVNGLLALPPGIGDFNDMHQRYSLDMVRKCVDAAEDVTPQVISYRRLSDVSPIPIRWLWPERIAKGKTTLIAGDPGLGKSQIAASLAAITTKGGQWPVDRSTAESGSVVILSAEDDAADTIRPRLEAAGADVTRVYVVDAVIEGELERHFNLARDLAHLSNLIKRLRNVALVIIDPISAYLGGTDSHKNADIRALLAPLGKLAAEHGVAIVCVSHLNKSGGGNALTRITGSLAFVAAPRAAYIVTQDPDDDTRRLFLPAKNNIGPDSAGFAYHIEAAKAGEIETSRICWHAEHVSVTANEALSIVAAEDRTETDEAMDFLQELLAQGAVKAAEAKKQAKVTGIGEKALRRARERLGIKPRKQDFTGGWYWELPSMMPQGAQDAQGVPSQNQGILEDQGHLRGGDEESDIETGEL